MMSPRSVAIGIALIALGAVLTFGIAVPDQVSRYVDVAGVGLVLVWSGILTIVMYVVMHRRPDPRARRLTRDQDDEQIDQWYENDVHRPGYAGQTRALPTVRGQDDDADQDRFPGSR